MSQVHDTRHGTMECFDSDTVVCEALRLYGEWAQLELEQLARLVPAGGVVLDIGAFVGSHTLAFARMVGPQGEVHSFEPRSAIRQLLQANVERNGLGQVRVHGCGVGSAEATLEIPSVAADISTDRAVNFGGLALRAADESAQAVESVAIRALDSFAFERLDLIKIDAEGMEPEVIAGARQTLARHRPVISAECNDLETGSEVLRALQALDCAVFGSVQPAFNPANYRRNAQNIFGDAGEASLLGVPRERVAGLQAAGALDGHAPIDSLDALALLMLHKAQYPTEVLARTAAAATLGIRYASPRSREQDTELVVVRGELAAVRERAPAAENQRLREAELAAARAAEVVSAQAAQLAAVQAELAACEERGRQGAAALQQWQQRALAAEVYRSTSVRYWLGRLRRRLTPSRHA